MSNGITMYRMPLADRSEDAKRAGRTRWEYTVSFDRWVTYNRPEVSDDPQMYRRTYVLRLGVPDADARCHDCGRRVCCGGPVRFAIAIQAEWDGVVRGSVYWTSEELADGYVICARCNIVHGNSVDALLDDILADGFAVGDAGVRMICDDLQRRQLECADHG